MLEVVFSDSAAGTMAVAIGHKGFLGGATSVIISDGTVSKEEIEKFQHQAEERERSGWENAIPLEGNRKDIVNLPLALSVGNISEAGICLERESALSLLLSILPDMASEIVTELLNTSRKNYATLLEKAQNGEPIRVWVGREPDDVCGLYWLLEQLRPIGFENWMLPLWSFQCGKQDQMDALSSITVGEKLNLITWDGWHLLGRSCQQITFVVWLTAGENSNRKILLFVLL